MRSWNFLQTARFSVTHKHDINAFKTKAPGSQEYIFFKCPQLDVDEISKLKIHLSVLTALLLFVWAFMLYEKNYF